MTFDPDLYAHGADLARKQDKERFHCQVCGDDAPRLFTHKGLTMCQPCINLDATVEAESYTAMNQPPLLCDACGSPDVRELEENGHFIGRRCVDCGSEQC